MNLLYAYFIFGAVYGFVKGFRLCVEEYHRQPFWDYYDSLSAALATLVLAASAVFIWPYYVWDSQMSKQ